MDGAGDPRRQGAGGFGSLGLCSKQPIDFLAALAVCDMEEMVWTGHSCCHHFLLERFCKCYSSTRDEPDKDYSTKGIKFGGEMGERINLVFSD
jgi:hypothetical protein